MAQEVVLQQPEANNEMENSEEDPGDYDEEQQDEEDQGEDDEEQFEMDEAEEQIILQQQNPMNVRLADEAAYEAEVEEAEEMMGEYAMEDDNEDMDEEDLDDEEMDDMPSDEDDQMMMPVGMGAHHNRGRHARNERVLQRDILFNLGEAPLGHAAFMGDRLRLERENAAADLARAQGMLNRGSNNFGPNWSQEEEAVSQILRNLRGLPQSNAAAGLGPAAAQEFNPNAPGQVAAQPLNHRYRIELEIAQQFKDSRQQLAQAKKSIE